MKKEMKKIIILIFAVFLVLPVFAQNIYDTCQNGQTAVIDLGDTVLFSTNASGSFKTYESRYNVDIVDNYFLVPASAPDDTIATLLALMSEGDGLYFEKGSVRRTRVVVPTDTLSFGVYGSGANPIFDGADVIAGFVNQGLGAEEITTGDFSSTTGWIGATSNIINGKFYVTEDNIFQNAISDGFVYAYSLDIDTATSGDVILQTYNGTFHTLATLNSVGTHKGVFTALSNNSRIYVDGINTPDLVIDNFSIKRVTDSTKIYTWMKTGITTEPELLYLNGTVGIEQDTIIDLAAEGDWRWKNDTLYVYTENGDPSGKIELGQRKLLFDISREHDISIKNITFQHSNEYFDEWSGAIGGAYTSNGITVVGCTFQKNSMGGMFLTNCSNVIVDRCTFTNNSESFKKGMNFRYYASLPGMRNITFTNNVSSDAGSHGCFIQGATKSEVVTNVDVHGNTFERCTDSGLYLVRCDSTVVYDNYFNAIGDLENLGEDYAIGINAVDNLDVYNNVIRNQLNNDAIQLWTSSTSSGHNVRIFRNDIRGVINGDGIQIIGGDESTNNLEIFSNVIDSVDGNGILIYKGDGTGNFSSLEVYNNTIIDGSGAGFSWTGAGGVDRSYFPCTLRNNIFFNNGTTNVTISGGTSGFVTSNNLWYRATGNVLDENYNTYTTATITNFEASAQSTDPLFTDAANKNFSLQTSSPAINAGVNVGLTTDILGNPIVGLPDIGAHEKQ